MFFNFRVFTFVCVAISIGGCAEYWAGDAIVVYDTVLPDGKWKPVSLSELAGSEEAFKGKRMRFHLDNGGYNEVVVERIDSTFVYAWSQWNDNTQKHLIKIRLRRVEKAEYWLISMGLFEPIHWPSWIDLMNW
ncbi:MAG: hypothetical protein JSW50_09970 [Candidatus Latescibacterota bacterium]|nr:MAG: hypothetical protein JSW50_09970 [Candidatus Latescibacterota bacterium]